MLQPTWHPTTCFYHFTLIWIFVKSVFFLNKFSHVQYFLRKEVSLKNTLCWRHRNPKLRSLMSCRCNSTEKSLFRLHWSIGLEISFSIFGTRDQADFLVVEVGQHNFVALLMIFMKSLGIEMNIDAIYFKYMFRFLKGSLIWFWHSWLLNILYWQHFPLQFLSDSHVIQN